jgi:hypothetical protein
MAATVSRHPNQGQDSVLCYDPLFQGSGPFSHRHSFLNKASIQEKTASEYIGQDLLRQIE